MAHWVLVVYTAAHVIVGSSNSGTCIEPEGAHFVTVPMRQSSGVIACSLSDQVGREPFYVRTPSLRACLRLRALNSGAECESVKGL